MEGIYYQNITGMRQDMTGARLGPAFSDGRLQVGKHLVCSESHERLAGSESLLANCRDLQMPIVFILKELHSNGKAFSNLRLRQA